MIRLAVGLVALVTGLIVVGVVASVGGPDDVEPLPPEPAVDMIAYATESGQVRIVSPDGSGDRLLSPDDEGFYTWPTWSPDAGSLVFSGVLRGTAEDVQMILYKAELRSGVVRPLHEGAKGFAGLLADGVVHYPLWSPDGSHLAFIASDEDGLALLLDDLRDDAPPVRLLGDGPLWLSWSADSRYLLAHRASDNLLIDTAEKDDTGGYAVREVNSLAERFRVPSWSPVENRYVYVERDAGGDSVMYISGPDGDRTRMDRAPVSQSALVWAPDGELLAVHGAEGAVLYLGQPVLVGEGFRLYRADGTPTDLGVGEVTIALFWSPDGSRIAYVTAPDARGVLTWRLFDVRTNDSVLLAEFVPSQQQLVLFSFFDQYALSHSPWSPDGESLVFAGRLWRGVTTVSQSLSSQVIVLPVDGTFAAVNLAEGIMAFWSPR